MRVIKSPHFSQRGGPSQSHLFVLTPFWFHCLERRTLGYMINKQKCQQSEQIAWGCDLFLDTRSSWEQAHTAREERSLVRSPLLHPPFPHLTTVLALAETKMWLIKYHAIDFMPNCLNSLQLILQWKNIINSLQKINLTPSKASVAFHPILLVNPSVWPSFSYVKDFL